MPNQETPRRAHARRGPRKSAKTNSFSAELPELPDWMAALRDDVEAPSVADGDEALPVAMPDGASPKRSEAGPAASQEAAEVGASVDTAEVVSTMVPLLEEQRVLLASLECSVASIETTLSEVADRLPTPPQRDASADELTTAELLAALKDRLVTWGRDVVSKVAATSGR